MTATTHRIDNPETTTPQPTLWRVAGGLALTHLLLMVVGVAVRGAPTTHSGQEGLEHSWSQAPLERILAATWVDLIGFVLLIPVLVFLSRAFGRSEVGAWASRTSAAAGLAYVVTVAGAGFAAGAAAAWGSAGGLDLETALTVNNIRNFSYMTGMTLLGLQALGLGIAALVDRRMTRWAGWGGVGVGTVALLTAPLAAIGVGTIGFPLWGLWWLGLALLMLRTSDSPRDGGARDASQ